MARLLFIVCLSLFPASVGVYAHDSPEHSVEDLTAHMKEHGESVHLLLSRAGQYRVMGRSELAIADLLRVLQIEPRHQGAQVELSRIYLAQGRHATSLHWIEQAIETAKAGADNSHLYAARGDVHMAQANYTDALKDYNRALAADSTQVDWYINRSLVQELLNRPGERIKGLWQGYEHTRSAVLYNEWVEALIEGGQPDRALQAIEPQLNQARLKSSWLIRRARARLAARAGRGLQKLAHDDLQAAIAEISARLNISRPDIDLLLDRALSHSLSGNVEAAHRDVSLAETQGATPRQIERLRRRLKQN